MIDDHNALSEYWYAMDKDTPAKRWWSLAPWHPAVARALRIDPADDGAQFALFPFRVARTEDGHRILAAYPCPRITGPVDTDHLGIETVVAWDPVANTVSIPDDAQAQIVGRFDGYYDGATLFGDPRAFFQQWAIDRARYFGFVKANAGKQWQARPSEPDLVPGCLAIGDIRHIRWRASEMPEQVACHGIDPARVNAAVLKSLNLPRFSAASNLRAVA